jgi:hypothetical protein
VIHFYQLDDDSGKYEKFGKMTDDGEIIAGEEHLLSIYPQERWEELSVERILASFSNGEVMAAHEDPSDMETDTDEFR